MREWVTGMPKREKVIWGLMACGCGAGVPNVCEVMECPYRGHQGACVHLLAQDALSLLKEQEARVIELSEISPNIFVWLEDRDDGTVFPLKGGVIDPDGDDYFRFDADFGEDFVYYPTGSFGKRWRVWDKCPTEDQMRDTPWKGDSDA